MENLNMNKFSSIEFLVQIEITVQTIASTTFLCQRWYQTQPFSASHAQAFLFIPISKNTVLN